MRSIEWNVVISIDLEQTQSQVSRSQYFTNLISPMTLSNPAPGFQGLSVFKIKYVKMVQDKAMRSWEPSPSHPILL